VATRQLTWWHQLNNGWGGSNYATINIKERRQRCACPLGGKWQHDKSTGSVSSAKAEVAVTRTTATPTTTRQRRDNNNNNNNGGGGALGLTWERMQQLRSANA
jgi:hypothetical protein